MCGLIGFIGNSKNPELSFNIFTNLFINTQIRGVDASGIYAVDKLNAKYFMKDGVPSEVLATYDDYIDLYNKNLNIAIGHCRQTSVGVGTSENNFNNHPFINEDLSVSIIHNGRIDPDEYDKMSKVYKTIGNCDSEIILRHIEENYKKNINYDSNNMVELLTHFVGMCPQSHYAIAVAEVNEDDRILYLLRNIHRSLWYVDLTKDLNQIFFASTDEILFTSIYPYMKKYLKPERARFYKVEPSCIVKFSMRQDEIISDSYKLKLHQKILLDYQR